MLTANHALAQPNIWRPTDLHEAWEIKKTLGEHSCFVSGGTWLRTQWEPKLLSMPGHLVSLERITAMHGIGEEKHDGVREITMGAMTTLAESIRHPFLKLVCPSFVEACRRIAAPSIRNLATIGGNILSATGDTIPALLSLNAQLRWFNGTNIETEPLEEWLLQRQMRECKWDGRILVDCKMVVQEYEEEGSFWFYSKIGRREAFTPSLVTVAGTGVLDEKGLFQQVSFVAGGGSTYSRRLAQSEAVLMQQPFSLELVHRVYTKILEEYTPNADAFASAAYRKQVAANLVAAELYRLGEKFLSGGECHEATS